MNKKLVGLSMVRNESDIIETFIRHNLTLLDELHVVTTIAVIIRVKFSHF